MSYSGDGLESNEPTKKYFIVFIGISVMLAMGFAKLVSAQQEKTVSSYGQTNQDQSFDQIKAARLHVKAQRAKEHNELLSSRNSLTKKNSTEVLMSSGKPIPVGPTVKLQGITWEQLNEMTPEQIKEK